MNTLKKVPKIIKEYEENKVKKEYMTKTVIMIRKEF